MEKNEKPRVRKETEIPSSPPDRVWKSFAPEYQMWLQYTTWEDAMETALMSSEDRKAMIDEDFRQEGGW